MTEERANAIAQALGGDTWQSGGGIWLVLIRRSDDKLVVLSEDAVCEYGTEAAFEAGKTSATIALC